MTTLRPSHPTQSTSFTHDTPDELPAQIPDVRRFQSALAFPAALQALQPARHELHKLLCDSGLARIADTVALAAHELMANAVTHGCAGLPPDNTLGVTATCDGRRVQVRVQDPSNGLPCVRPETNDQEGGRGMLLVEAFADRWGVDKPPNGDAGKSVWMELDLSPSECAEIS
ncbi:ATP-binding protein [Streptomyces rochei]|uniref:ATP-binding protein n=1 Tax=Streptomyces rochei TaxID=1928 RepID=UPI00363B7891